MTIFPILTLAVIALICLAIVGVVPWLIPIVVGAIEFVLIVLFNWAL